MEEKRAEHRRIRTKELLFGFHFFFLEVFFALAALGGGLIFKRSEMASVKLRGLRLTFFSLVFRLSVVIIRNNTNPYWKKQIHSGMESCSKIIFTLYNA